MYAVFMHFKHVHSINFMVHFFIKVGLAFPIKRKKVDT